MRNSLAECECTRAKRGPSLWTLPVTRKCMDNNKKHWKIVKQRAQRSNKIYYNGITIRISSKWQIENERDAKAWKYTQREWEYRKRQQAKNYLKPNFLVEHCCLLCCLFAMRFRSFADRCTVVMTLPSHRAVQCVCVSLCFCRFCLLLLSDAMIPLKSISRLMFLMLLPSHRLVCMHQQPHSPMQRIKFIE